MMTELQMPQATSGNLALALDKTKKLLVDDKDAYDTLKEAINAHVAAVYAQARSEGHNEGWREGRMNNERYY